MGSAPAFFGKGESDAQARDIMDAAWEMGITLFETADAYGGGRSESAIGGWLRANRILRQIEGSLPRLGVERVELYMIHEPDPETPLDETLGALDSL